MRFHIRKDLVAYLEKGASAPSDHRLDFVDGHRPFAFPGFFCELFFHQCIPDFTDVNFTVIKRDRLLDLQFKDPWTFLQNRDIQNASFGNDSVHLHFIRIITRFVTKIVGERKKLQVACALWRRPDVLVLDEPTNHIDHDARERIAALLKRFRGIGILISHDRELLDEVAARCASFEPGGIVVRSGGYSAAHAQAELERTSLVRERRAAKDELAKLAAEKAERNREAERAQARRSKRHLDPKDKSAKAKIDLAVYTGQDGARGKLSVQMDARVQAAERRVAAAFVHKRYDGDLWVDAEPSPRKVVAHIEATSIPCGAGALEIPELFVGNRDHIGIVGPNGAGKSTLLAYMTSRLANDLVVLNMPQELSAEERARVIDGVRALAPTERGRVLSTVAQLNSDPDRILEGAKTSPGELRKLMLAAGLLEHPVLIIMDEPTNHLDLHSTEALERALAAYPGALLLVSHDRVFLEGCTNSIWEVRDGCVSLR